MSVSNLEEELDLYKTQLGQVEQALAASGEIDELLKLKKDLQELIQLTEESLLSVKKESILRSLENSNSVQENIDEEYAAFQAALSEDITPSASLSTASQDVDNDSQSEIQDNSDDDNNDVLDLCSKFEELVGMKCCAPYSQEWGSFSYHNAIVSGILKVDHAEVPQLSVVFCHPTQRSMVPCPYFLEDTCKYDSDKCRFSHGHAVKLEDIKEYVEPDYSLLLLESKCLCRYEDDVWYKATVVDIHENNNYSVIFDEYGHDVHDISIPDIIPCIHDSNENDSDADDHSDEVESDEEDQDLPVYLYNPSSSCVQMGEWENHTKGIASKLMAKMGYNVGEGLGKNSQGKTEPVPILLLPQGKSLDKIMELKEKAGNQDLYDVMKRHDKQKKKALEKSEKAYQAVGPETKDVFDFINHKLANKRGNLKDLIHKEHLRTSNPKISKNHKQISEADLKSKSDRSLNIQLYKTDEEKKNVRKEIERLKVSLSRNEQRDKKMAAQIRQKISNMENYLQQLESSQQAIHSHQEKRSGHKKLTVF